MHSELGTRGPKESGSPGPTTFTEGMSPKQRLVPCRVLSTMTFVCVNISSSLDSYNNQIILI